MAAPRSSGSGHPAGQFARAGAAGRLPEDVVGLVAHSALRAQRRGAAAGCRSEAADGVNPLDEGGSLGPAAAFVLISSHGIAPAAPGAELLAVSGCPLLPCCR